LKILKENHSSLVNVAQYQHEFTIVRTLALECVPKAYVIEMHEEIPFILLEDFDGDSLNNLMATALSVQNPLLNHPNVLEGTLAYMSPEQTGRMNRSVDFCTDFYSLTVTLYEMF